MSIRPNQIRDLALVIVAALLGSYFYITTRPIEHPAGILAAKDPEQIPPQYPTPIVKGDFTLQPRARFTAYVRVLGSERYYLGKLAEVAKIDLAAGWGPMSNSAVLASIKITQGRRFYVWKYDSEPPISRTDIETHSANWHLVAADDAVWGTLRRLRVGDFVHLAGFLVDIEHPDLETLRTSLTRDDTGAGACEVFYVESASIDGR